MKKTAFVIAYLLVANAYCQATLETVKESRIVHNEIHLIVSNESTVDFTLDKSTSRKTLDSVNYFQVKDAEFRVNINFINPLKYKISSESKLVDEELFKKSNEYLSTVISFFQTMGGAKEKEVGANLRTAGATTGRNVEFSDPQMADLYIYIGLKEPDFFSNSATRGSNFLDEIQKLKFEKSKGKVISQFDESFLALEKIKSLEEVEAAILSNSEKMKSAQDSINSLNERWEAIMRTFNNISFKDPNLKNVVEYKLSLIRQQINDFNKTVEELNSKYNKIEEFFKQLVAKEIGENKFLLCKVGKLKTSKRAEIQINVQKVEFNSNEKSVKYGAAKTYLLHVRRYSPLIPVVSSGILYSNLKFIRYGTGTDAAGNTIVTKSHEDASEVVTGAYLNLYLNNPSDYDLFFQFGVGPSSDKPLLFLGAGVGLLNRINLSAGMIYTWFPELDGLSEGDPVTGTSQIEDSIKYTFDTTPKFYIGLNINLSK